MITNKEYCMFDRALRTAKRLASDIGTDEEIKHINEAWTWFENQPIYSENVAVKAKNFAHTESRKGSNDRYLQGFAKECEQYGCD